MAEQSITLRDHDVNPEPITDNMTTLVTTGAGNGFAIPTTKLGFVFFDNPVAATATITIKGQPTAAQTARGVTVGDETVAIADGGDPVSWYYHSDFKNTDGNVIVECDQLIKVKAIRRPNYNS